MRFPIQPRDSAGPGDTEWQERAAALARIADAPPPAEPPPATPYLRRLAALVDAEHQADVADDDTGSPTRRRRGGSIDIAALRLELQALREAARREEEGHGAVATFDSLRAACATLRGCAAFAAGAARACGTDATALQRRASAAIGAAAAAEERFAPALHQLSRMEEELAMGQRDAGAMKVLLDRERGRAGDLQRRHGAMEEEARCAREEAAREASSCSALRRERDDAVFERDRMREFMSRLRIADAAPAQPQRIPSSSTVSAAERGGRLVTSRGGSEV